MANTKIYFEVVTEGAVYCFHSFNTARDEFYELVNCGFHNVALYRVEEVNGDKYVAVWNDRSACFFPR